MADILNNNELIDNYLKGILSGQEKAAFEKQLESDASLRSEFEIQKDIVSVIRNARMAELKFSLASVHVPWYYLISTGWKIAAAVSLISVTGAGVFYLYNHGETHQSTEQVKKSVVPDLPKEVPSRIIPVEPENKNTASAETAPAQKTEKQASTLKNKPATTLQPVETKKKENTQTIPSPVNVPQPEMDQSAGDNSDHDLAVNVPDQANPSVPQTEDKMLTVNTVKSKDYHFDYSFSEGKLKLYGDFPGNPYKILEVNSSTGKEYFLFYNESYYYLKQDTRDIKPLEKVMDDGLISELNILKNNK